MPEDLLIKVTLDLFMVLRYLHCKCGVVHRDINPSNIMITFDLDIKVTDFGLSQEITKGLSKDKAFEGTLAYSSPETIENIEVTDKADIWSLGCVIYELLESKQAFHSTNPLTLAKMIAHGEYELPSFDTNKKEKLAELIIKCLTIDPKHRPNITELLKDWIDEVVDYNTQLKLKLVSN